MRLDINNYPGSKGGAGVSQWIINHIPKYWRYYELFAGSAVIARTLYSAVSKGKGITLVPRHFVVDKSESVINQLREVTEKIDGRHPLKFNAVAGDGIAYLKSLIEGPTEKEFIDKIFGNLFAYLDPPYIKDSRRSQSDIYEFEWSIDQHKEFLNLVKQANFPVMISHYDHELYNETLKGWSTSTFQTMTRAGVAEEKIYMNYDIAQMDLATYEFLGTDYVDRQRINRRKKAYANKFLKMPKHERQAILSHIKNALK